MNWDEYYFHFPEEEDVEPDKSVQPHGKPLSELPFIEWPAEAKGEYARWLMSRPPTIELPKTEFHQPPSKEDQILRICRRYFVTGYGVALAAGALTDWQLNVYTFTGTIVGTTALICLIAFAWHFSAQERKKQVITLAAKLTKLVSMLSVTSSTHLTTTRAALAGVASGVMSKSTSSTS
jgi:hypothetical protein